MPDVFVFIAGLFTGTAAATTAYAVATVRRLEKGADK